MASTMECHLMSVAKSLRNLCMMRLWFIYNFSFFILLSFFVVLCVRATGSRVIDIVGVVLDIGYRAHV